MNTYRVNFRWKENNNAVYQAVQHDFQIRKDAKTPAEAAKLFHKEWTSENNGYEITSVECTFGDGPETFHPKKYSRKNW